MFCQWLFYFLSQEDVFEATPCSLIFQSDLLHAKKSVYVERSKYEKQISQINIKQIFQINIKHCPNIGQQKLHGEFSPSQT